MFTRLTWPRAIFVSSVYNSYFPVKEALYLGIPCLGVVDTNVPGRFVSMPFPGNDESINCLVFYTIWFPILFYWKNLLLLVLDFLIYVHVNVY